MALGGMMTRQLYIWFKLTQVTTEAYFMTFVVRGLAAFDWRFNLPTVRRLFHRVFMRQ